MPSWPTGFFGRMALIRGHIVDFSSLRGLVQSIRRLLRSDADLVVSDYVKLNLRNALAVRQVVSKIYGDRSLGAHPDSPIIEGESGTPDSSKP